MTTAQTLASGLRERLSNRVILQPHQIPPWESPEDPTHTSHGFIMLLGRGGGKSFATMWDLHLHMSKIPNLRARVIAPTLGDGIAAAVDGPNGLLKLSNGQARWLPSAPGGACVRYPNGSRAWIVGTPTEKDVDRLRALTNCIAEGELVQTDRGLVPIEDVTTADLVLTRAGYRRVLWAWKKADDREVYEVVTESGERLIGTGDHRVWTENRGWVPLQLLKNTDILVVCPTNSPMSTTAERDTTRSAGGRTTGHREDDYSTSRSTKTRTDPYLTGTTSTTWTLTGGTTTRRTLWRSLARSITDSTWRRGKTISSICGNEGARSGRSTLVVKTPAPTVGLSSTTGDGSWRRDVPPATRSGERYGTPTGTTGMLTRSVRSAVSSSERSGTTLTEFSATNTSRPAPAPAPHDLRVDAVKTVSLLSRTSAVYDLTVEGEHEFFAGGVLVHNCDYDVFEELFANPCAQSAFDQAALSRRRGVMRYVVSSTPRPHSLIKEWENDSNVTIRRGKSTDNKHIPLDWLAKLESMYKGTRLYRQEVLGEVIEDVDGALWKANDIERSRTPGPPSAVAGICDRIVVGVDPPTGNGTCGIVVVGQDANGHMYVLDDRSVEDASPHVWAARVKEAADTYDAVVVAEINQGGQMVKEVINSAGHDLPIHTVNATKSKKTRAEPIALLWEVEEQVVHMVTTSPKLVDQMCEWVPGESASPDRVDALVWACWFLRSRHTATVRGSTMRVEGPVGLPSALSSVRMGRF